MSELTLVLVRHAKTEQEGPPTQGDHGRRLLPRGVADAQVAGRWLVESGLRPDLVLCSTAVRAEQTWQAMAGPRGESAASTLSDVEVWRERRVYNASSEELLMLLAEVPEAVRCLAVVGHAPGVPDLAVDLADQEQADAWTDGVLAAGFPTMTCAVLRTGGSADALTPGSMTLSTVYTARAER
jgi:phosphohistidine phosphatase